MAAYSDLLHSTMVRVVVDISCILMVWNQTLEILDKYNAAMLEENTLPITSFRCNYLKNIRRISTFRAKALLILLALPTTGTDSPNQSLPPTWRP